MIFFQGAQTRTSKPTSDCLKCSPVIPLQSAWKIQTSETGSWSYAPPLKRSAESCPPRATSTPTSSMTFSDETLPETKSPRWKVKRGTTARVQSFKTFLTELNFGYIF